MPGSKKLRRRLKTGRKALLKSYDEEALHKIRVTLRRVRSLLKEHDNSKAEDLRHNLGDIADITNAARDWDTLVTRARMSLRPSEFRLVQPWLEERQAASHGPVLAMLESEQWSDAMEDLKKYIKDEGLKPMGDYGDGDNLCQAQQHVDLAWQKAQAEDDNKHWHKLRVAIKELRYRLDSTPQDAREVPLLCTLKQCKLLQEQLGIWHDTVVHRELVREFSRSLDPLADAGLVAVVETWCRRMEREAQDALHKTRRRLEGKGASLVLGNRASSE